jgi:hypothetical protein
LGFYFGNVEPVDICFTGGFHSSHFIISSITVVAELDAKDILLPVHQHAFFGLADQVILSSAADFFFIILSAFLTS